LYRKLSIASAGNSFFGVFVLNSGQTVMIPHPFSEAATRFVRNGIGARSGTRSVLFGFQAARRAPEPSFTKFQDNGGVRHTRIRPAKLPPVRAQGIGGARSGRAINKKHAMHVFY
jgi:hypothetical protein